MMDIWSAIGAALVGLGLPLSANQFLAASSAELPDTFLVYQMISDPARQHADNTETLRNYRVQVTIFRRSGLSNLPDIEGAMNAAGFTRLVGRELPYNQDTRHYALAIDFNYLDEE